MAVDRAGTHDIVREPLKNEPRPSRNDMLLLLVPGSMCHAPGAPSKAVFYKPGQVLRHLSDDCLGAF